MVVADVVKVVVVDNDVVNVVVVVALVVIVGAPQRVTTGEPNASQLRYPVGSAKHVPSAPPGS